jgi:glutamine---fructose-6-phosphate transaminase (isomerizing)
MTTLLEQEIYSQPEIIARLLDAELGRTRAIAAQLPPCDYVLIAARGSSDHAATYAKYAWGGLAGLPVALATPALHTLYQQPPRMRGALVVGISQSGQSPDIVAVLEEGRRQGRPTLAITNDERSPLAAVADHVVGLRAGAERSVAATKTYTAQLAVVAMLAAAWSGDAAHLAALEQLPAALAATLEANASLGGQAARYAALRECVVVGRGYNYATALELALKLKELTYTQALGYSAADFRHGPIAAVAAGLPAILVMPQGATFADMHQLADDLRAQGADLFVIGDAELPFPATLLPHARGLPEWLSPIVAIVPGQLLALHLAVAKGFEPDRPRGLQKVTRTL